MTSVESPSAKRLFETERQESHKLFKATDLPLSSAQRSAIDGLLHTFKKSGEFDAIRKIVYSQFDASEVKTTLTNALTGLAEAELERDPNLLSKDRRQAAPLVEGAVERSEIYRNVERDLDAFVEEYVIAAEAKMRELRRKDVGLEAAGYEEQLGSKTEDDYRNESNARRQAVAKRRQEEAEVERRRVADEKRKVEEERRRKQEKEEKEARDAQEAAMKKRLELEAEREKLRLEKEDKDRQRAEYLELKKRQDAEWARERAKKEEEERQKREKEREKEIEAVALEELIRECEQAAAKPKIKLERSVSPRRKSTPMGSGSKESALASIMKAELRESEMAKAGKDDPGPSYANHTTYSKSAHRPGGETRGSRSPSHADSRRYLDRDERSKYSTRPSYDSRSRHEGYYDSRSRYPEEHHTNRTYDDRDSHGRDDRSDRDRRHCTRSRSVERRNYRDDTRSGTTTHRTYRERSRSAQRYRRKSRSRSPKDIDRYVPGSSSRSKPYEHRSSRDDDSSRRESGHYEATIKREESRDDRHSKDYGKREESRDDRSVKDYTKKEGSRDDRHEREFSSREEQRTPADRYYSGRSSGREREEDDTRSRRRSRSRSHRRESRRSRSRG